MTHSITVWVAPAKHAPRRAHTTLQAIETARRLMLEFNAWVVRAHALRKVFVSVKGIYFQVT